MSAARTVVFEPASARLRWVIPFQFYAGKEPRPTRLLAAGVMFVGGRCSKDIAEGKAKARLSKLAQHGNFKLGPAFQAEAENIYKEDKA